jgi:hypothetical protein
MSENFGTVLDSKNFKKKLSGESPLMTWKIINPLILA